MSPRLNQITAEMNGAERMQVTTQTSTLHRSGLWVRVAPHTRVTAVCVAGSCAAVLAVARMLTPDGRGFGTHEQLGLLPCATMKWFGIPCPFCGMTTSFSLLAHGQFEQAFWNQPAAAFLFAGAVSAIPVGLLVGLTGRGMALPRSLTQPRFWLVPAIGMLAAAWVYKVLTVLAG